MKKRWDVLAKEEGRICSTCGRLIAKNHWKFYLDHGECFMCWLGSHWSRRLGAGGSSRYDNRSIDDVRDYWNW